MLISIFHLWFLFFFVGFGQLVFAAENVTSSLSTTLNSVSAVSNTSPSPAVAQTSSVFEIASTSNPSSVATEASISTASAITYSTFSNITSSVSTSSYSSISATPSVVTVISTKSPDTVTWTQLSTLWRVNTSISTWTTSVTASEPSPSLSPAMATTTKTIMMEPTVAASTSTPTSSSESSHHTRNVTIALSVVLGVLFVALVICAVFLGRRWMQRRGMIKKAGDESLDEEIETWRASKATGDTSHLTGGDRRSSGSQRDWTDEKNLQRPPTAKAPNARTGLTDSAIPGADPFVMPPRRNSRLQKRSSSRPGSISGHHRSHSSISDREKPRLSVDRPKTSDRPSTPRQTWEQSAAEKETRPPLPEEASEKIRNSAGSYQSNIVHSPSHSAHSRNHSLLSQRVST